MALGLVGLWAGAAIGAPPRAHTPSGEPVPRYVTLKAAPVNARGGPGEDYRALWQYTAKGLPLQVVEETDAWRRVCDPEGGLGWVRASAIDGHRAVMRLGHDLPIRARPEAGARTIAMLAGRAAADLLLCKGGWCKLSVDHANGWVRAGEVWGVSPAPQCRAQ
jgi:SH3-like domain-containing protein